MFECWQELLAAQGSCCRLPLLFPNHCLPPHLPPPLNTSQQVTRGLFGSSKGSFTSFFTRTGYGGGSPGQGGEASIHGGAMGGFRQVGRGGLGCEVQ